jgi:hypothetical protein
VAIDEPGHEHAPSRVNLNHIGRCVSQKVIDMALTGNVRDLSFTNQHIRFRKHSK